MEDNTLIDQTQVAEDVEKRIRYDFIKDFLVKPLDPIMVKKEFNKPVPTSEAKKDKDGIEAIDYDKVETEVKEVESDFARGVVIKVPYEFQRNLSTNNEWKPMEIKVGDVILYSNTSRKRYFDLLKDTQLVSQFDVIGVEHPAA